MGETLLNLPTGFWLTLFFMVSGLAWSVGKIRSGIGIPMIGVFGTVAAWYVGDVLYNDYADFSLLFTRDNLESAWLQVTLFLVSFWLLAPLVNQLANNSVRNNTSFAGVLFRRGVSGAGLQRQITLVFYACATVWMLLLAFAILRLDSEALYYVFPFLDHKADPWSRGRLGGGIDALLSLAAYFQTFSASMFGLVAALSTNSKVRPLAVVACLLAWPYFVLDRTRNAMIATVLPGILAYTLLRLRATWLAKLALLGVCFLLTNAWFAFVIANRTDMTITDALQQKGFNLDDQRTVRHQGLNMYEELCWINSLIDDGTYQPNLGARYLAEVSILIPRTLWAGKPTPGLDYAIARGQGLAGGDGGVGASISTGMIGQGVVNFGPFFGPLAAAFLMSLWTATLARLDLTGHKVGRMPLYSCGLILTFNLGRDITLLTLYTFMFGAVVVWLLDRYSRNSRSLPVLNVRRTRPAVRLTR